MMYHYVNSLQTGLPDSNTILLQTPYILPHRCVSGMPALVMLLSHINTSDDSRLQSMEINIKLKVIYQLAPINHPRADVMPPPYHQLIPSPWDTLLHLVYTASYLPLVTSNQAPQGELILPLPGFKSILLVLSLESVILH